MSSRGKRKKLRNYYPLPAAFLKKNASAATAKPKSGEKITYNEVSRKLNCSSRTILAIIRKLEIEDVISRSHKLHANFLSKSSN